MFQKLLARERGLGLFLQGWQRSPEESPEAGGQRGKQGKERPSLSLRMHLPPLETPVFCRWEDEVLNDFIRGNDGNQNAAAGCMTYANLLSRDKY